jgi:hypothetical protein
VFDAVARCDPERVIHLASRRGRPRHRHPRGARVGRARGGRGPPATPCGRAGRCAGRG